jgi:polyhydroxyalkanoate synthesis regulator phasin
MLKKFWIIVSILTVVVLVAMTGGVALADDGSGNAGTSTEAQKVKVFLQLLKMDKAKLTETLTVWVTDGKITQEQANNITQAWQTGREKIRDRIIFRQLVKLNDAKVKEILARWVASDKITPEQSSKIYDAWYRAHAAIGKVIIADKILKMDEVKIDEVLTNLIANGKIDGTQAGKIKAWWTAKHK